MTLRDEKPKKHDAEPATDLPAATLGNPRSANPAEQALQKVQHTVPLCNGNVRKKGVCITDRIRDCVYKIELPATLEIFTLIIASNFHIQCIAVNFMYML